MFHIVSVFEQTFIYLPLISASKLEMEMKKQEVDCLVNHLKNVERDVSTLRTNKISDPHPRAGDRSCNS